ncbi:glutamate receptor 1-like [Ptychodera flava]|uniref:glutamate receptor 1-like n=1 Tax=Ptychodera flava TaxID=63121 RepID=UPI00396A3610
MRTWVLLMAMVAIGQNYHEIHAEEYHPRFRRQAEDNDNTTSVTPSQDRDHIRVTSILVSPFLMEKEGTSQGNARYEGYIADVLRLVAEDLAFDYTLTLVADNKYGSFRDGNWSGMVGELISGDADMAAAPLTITSTREEVIDFSKPFVAVSVRVIQKRPSVEMAGNLFALFAPFTVGVWICILVAYLVVGLVIYFLARVSPYEWRALAKRGKVSGYKGRHFNLMNSFWFTFSALTFQGYHKAPRSIATRVLSGFWFFFVIVILFAYLSNLSPFLTAQKTTNAIQSIEKLSQQTTVRYGAIRDGATATFIENSNIEIYQQMWRAMISHTPSVFVESEEEGIRRVRESEGKYAFIGESQSLEYLASRPPCDLSFVPGHIYMRSHGFAFPQNSTLRDRVTMAILKLREEGILEELHRKWWYGPCDFHDTTADVVLRPPAVAITLGNISGVFIILLIGIALSVPLALCEWVVYNSREEKKKEKQRRKNVPKAESGAQTESSGV